MVRWDLSFSSVAQRWRAHTGSVRGLVESLDGNFLYSCGDDNCIQKWDMRADLSQGAQGADSRSSTGGPAPGASGSSSVGKAPEPSNTWRSESVLTGLDHHWQRPLLVSSGETVDLWDLNR